MTRKLILATFVIAATVLGFAISEVGGASAAGDLLSQGRPVRASTSEALNPARNAVDGSLVRRWAASSGAFPQWIRVDLGASHSLGGVTIDWHSPPARPRSYRYTLQTSPDGSAWAAFRYGVSARYVRVYFYGLASGSGWAGLREIRVYAADSPSDRPTPTPSPSVPGPNPILSPSGLVMTKADIATLKGRIAAGQQPWASAWTSFQGIVAGRMTQSPQVFTASGTVAGPGSASERAYDRDGHIARDVAIGYAISGDLTRAHKARSFLLAWAQGNRPLSMANMSGDNGWGGTYLAHGLFGFAFAYDLTKDSGVYSSVDKATVESWFRRTVDAQQTFLDRQDDAYVFSHPNMISPYMWSNPRGLTFHEWDRYVGGDGPAMILVSQLALAIQGRHSAALAKMFDSSYVFSVPNVLRASCMPRNAGDGAGTASVPQVQIFKPGSGDNAGRGGNIDYMTYNAREAAIIYQMARSIGKATQAQDEMLRASFLYLSRFFGSDARPPVAPNDSINRLVCLSRMQIARHLWDDAAFISDVAGQTNLNESQFLGPTILTQP